jgi:hypothetical protein
MKGVKINQGEADIEVQAFSLFSLLNCAPTGSGPDMSREDACKQLCFCDPEAVVKRG